MRRYLRVTGRVKLWVSGLHPDVSAAIMIRKQSLESSTVSRLTGRFTAEVQHRKQNNGHHFQQELWRHTQKNYCNKSLINLELHNKHRMGGGGCDGDSFTAETHIGKVHFYATLTTRI